MKKLIALLLSLMLVFSLAACGNNPQAAETEPATSTPVSEETQEPETSEETEAADTESTGGKTLVVYYSASGNTENVSNVIAKTLGADLFELEPVEPYSNDDLNWTNDDSRVTREHENEDERDVELVSATVDNWSEYDTVFIGYPIWWGIAAWPVDEFIETNDFTGKQSFRLLHLQVPVWDKAANCLQKWQEPVTGRKASVSVPVLLRMILLPGWKA